MWKLVLVQFQPAMPSTLWSNLEGWTSVLLCCTKSPLTVSSLLTLKNVNVLTCQSKLRFYCAKRRLSCSTSPQNSGDFSILLFCILMHIQVNKSHSLELKEGSDPVLFI